ncbi:MAG TPA: outer membrane beta-barrel protein [Gammaproteobacteria bacterium]
MKLKQTLLFTASSLLILASASSQAGRQGIDFYYGLGLGAAQPTDVDASATGEIILGIEEDGWAIEGIAYNGMDAATDVTNIDYSLSGTEIGLAYRTIEKNDRYYKIKYSRADMDFETINTTTDNSSTTESSGNSYTVGIGFRMDRDARLELDYSYHNIDALSDPVHFISLRYLWGGSPYQGRNF